MTVKELLDIAKKKPQKTKRSFGVFYSDKFPSEIYRMRHPGLDEKEYEYIEKNWINPVQKLVGDAVFETQKIFSDSNYSIQSDNETINDFIREYEIQGFFKNIYWPNIIQDSESVLTYHIKHSEFIEKKQGIELGNEYLPIHPYIVTSENILHKDKTTLVYKVKGDKRNNFVALYYNADNFLTYEHYSYDNISDKIEPIVFWQFDNDSNKRYYRQADGIKITDDNELVIKSYFSPSESILSTIIIDSINVGVTKTRTTFPIPVVSSEPCEETGCRGGIVDAVDDKGEYCTEKCKTCLGTGAKNLFTPFNTIHLLRENAAIGNNTIPSNPVYWLDPPQGALDSTRQEIRENRNIAFDYLGITYTNTEVQGSPTALEKIVERERTFGTYQVYSQDVAKTMQWWYNGWTELMFPLENDNQISVLTYNNFRITSSAEVSKLFTELLKDNAPIYELRKLLKEYYTLINEIEKFKIVDKYYLYKSDDMSIKKGSLGYYDKIQIVISDNIMKWVDDEGVMDMNELKLDLYLKNKAAQLMNIPIVTEGAIADISTDNGGNKLSQTASGLESVISVGKAIATGVYDLQA